MRKKAIGILVSIVMMLAFMLGSTSVALAEDPDYSIIRVKLSIGTPTSFSFYADGNYSIDGTAIDRQLYTAKIEEGVINLYIGATKIASSTDGTLKLTQHTGTAERNNFIWLNNAEHGYCGYLGNMTFSISDGALQLVNSLYLEEYLYGVVPHEMSNSFPLEALKSQAIAARTYAANRISGGTSSSYDLGDTSKYQVYEGFNASDTNAIQAVNETAGKVLKYNDSFVQCYYSASNGGWTEITQHRWTATEPLKAYDVIKPDPYDVANPYSKQEVLILPKTVTAENPLQYKQQVDGSLKTTGNSAAGIANASQYLRLSALPKVKEKGYIASVSDDLEIVGFSNIVAHTYDTGSGQHHGGEGSYDGNDYTGKNDCKDMLKADVTMTVLANRYATPEDGGGYLLGDVDMNGSISISDYTLVRLHILGVKTLSGDALKIADVDRNDAVSISDYTYIRLHILALKSITARTNDGVVKEPVEVTFTIDFPTMDVNGAYKSFFDSSLGMFVVESDDTNWYIYQRRYGHGIGMSQRGAQQRAKDADPNVNTYTKILEFYYEGTTLSDLPMDPYVLTDFPGADSVTNAKIVNCTRVNVRSVPNSDSSDTKIGTLPAGARIQVTDAEAAPGWDAVNYGGQTAYIYDTYIQID